LGLAGSANFYQKSSGEIKLKSTTTGICFAPGGRKIGIHVLRSAMFAALIALPFNTALAGNAGENALESIGLLTFETGGTDRFARYDDGEFGNPSSTNPPSSGGDVADAVQPVFDESNNKCELDQSPVPGFKPLVILSAVNGNPGFVGDSMGVFSRGGGGNARGVKCGRVNDSEKLIIDLGPDLDLDDDGDLDAAVVKTRLDMEFKGNAIAVLTAKFAGSVTGQYYINSGSNTGAGAPSGLDPTVFAFEIPCGATGSDSNNDNGPNDNCAVEFPFDYGVDGQAPAALWDSLEIEVRDGQVSLEGGGDYGSASYFNRSEFELVRVDGILDCQGTFSTSGGKLQGARLSNTDGGCGSLVPYSLGFDGEEFELLFETDGQDLTFVVNAEWDTEGSIYPIPPTKFSWEAGNIDWTTCDTTNPATCITLSVCDEGQPIRSCSNDSTQACSTNDDCDPDASCDLTDITPPTPPGSFTDLDPSRNGPQYACVCGETLTPLGFNGRDGVDDGGFPNGDDTVASHILVEQCIFIEGDARGSRRLY
jgi:hypothetical protein